MKRVSAWRVRRAKRKDAYIDFWNVDTIIFGKIRVPSIYEVLLRLQIL